MMILAEKIQYLPMEIMKNNLGISNKNYIL